MSSPLHKIAHISLLPPRFGGFITLPREASEGGPLNQGYLIEYIYVSLQEAKPARLIANTLAAHSLKPIQLENLLYLIRCGMIESVPRRRILSFS
jgi:hypothetical protein